MDILESKLHSILEVAAKIQSFFVWNPTRVADVIKACSKKHHALHAEEMIASDGYMFMVITSDPKLFMMDVVDGIKGLKVKDREINPIHLFTKLADKEYMLDLNGFRVCYALRSSVASHFLLKSIACRRMTLVRNFLNYIDPETNKIMEEHLKELHPEYDYETKAIVGGRMKPKEKKRENNFSYSQRKLRLDIINRLVEYVRNNSSISKGVVFVNDVSECEKHAINIIFTNIKYKDAISDYLKLLIESDYKHHSFKSFKHADFSVPYDFRITKYSCIMNSKTIAQPLYIANLYNMATYDPMPCIKHIENETFINMAHPIIKLRLLYIDMYMIEEKTKKNGMVDNNIFMDKLYKAYEELKEYSKSLHWVGYYKDESYEKNKFNFSFGLQSHIESFIV